jgi:UDP-glucose 4-epimerase
MKTTAIVGGAGRLGRYIVDELRSVRDVIVLDRNIDGATAPAKMIDITVLDDLRRAFDGVDEVIHVAGIDGHVQAPQEVFFETNVMGTWNVLQAAVERGIRKVIVTSSTSATGFNVGPPFRMPDYFPIDEEHPLFPVDAYGLSKQTNEVTAASFGRRPGMQVICIRPTYVVFPELVPHLRGDKFEGEVPDAFRETPPLLRTYIDPRDLARCYRLALDYEPAGYHLFWACAADTFEPTPTLDYFKSVYGKLPEIRQPETYKRDPHAGVIDCSRARDMLNWRPEFSWPQIAGNSNL